VSPLLKRFAWAGLAWLLLLVPAWADGVYKCRKPDGTVGFSDRPCPGADVEQIARGAPKEPEDLRYMTSRCLRLREELRYANREGEADDSARQQLQSRYQRECQTQQRELRERAEQQEAKARRDREFAQCVELRENIRSRRQREAAMTAGERGDLERLVAAFEQRCRSL